MSLLYNHELVKSIALRAHVIILIWLELPNMLGIFMLS